MRNAVGHGTPRGEREVRPPRASLGARAHEGNWRCCGVDYNGQEPYERHLRRSHGGDARGPHAPGGSGQGVGPESFAEASPP